VALVHPSGVANAIDRGGQGRLTLVPNRMVPGAEVPHRDQKGMRRSRPKPGHSHRSRPRDCRAARPFLPMCASPALRGPHGVDRRRAGKASEMPLEWRHEQPGRTPLHLRIVPLHAAELLREGEEGPRAYLSRCAKAASQETCHPSTGAMGRHDAAGHRGGCHGCRNPSSGSPAAAGARLFFIRTVPVSQRAVAALHGASFHRALSTAASAPERASIQ
jgi:hypothetical protein